MQYMQIWILLGSMQLLALVYRNKEIHYVDAMNSSCVIYCLLITVTSCPYVTPLRLSNIAKKRPQDTTTLNKQCSKRVTLV